MSSLSRKYPRGIREEQSLSSVLACGGIGRKFKQRMNESPPIVIVGAGIAGLACARVLHKAGRKVIIYEASDASGGRLRTDEVDGFRLDRGFQVFLPAWPEARRVLDYEKLDLKPFYRGARVIWAGKHHLLADPLHNPMAAMRTLRDAIVPWKDKWLTLLLRKHVLGLRELPRDDPEMPAIEFLQQWGFSEVFINHFMRPFFGGVFMDRELHTSSRLFQFIFAMCDRGGTALPALGMQRIADLLVADLPPGCIQLNRRVFDVSPGEVTLEGGEVVQAQHIIVAVGEADAARLLPAAFPQWQVPMRASTCLYFATDRPMPSERLLYIDGDLKGPVNHACVVSAVAPERAPAGQQLISVSVLGAPSSVELTGVVREQMREWFGDSVDGWRHLRTYQVRNALSQTRQLLVGDEPLSVRVGEGLYRCGDYCEDVTLNGALISARKAAKACLESLV